MTSYAEIKTKKAKVEFIKSQLETNPRWLLKGLITIFDLQTEDEKASTDTHEHNSVGFTAFDAELMSNLAKKAISKGARELISKKLNPDLRGMFSAKEQDILKSRMKKYAGQLSRIAETKAKN